MDILVVDGHEAERKQIAALLASHGHTVRDLPDFPEQADKADLVVLNGCAKTTLPQHEEDLSGTPVVVLSPTRLSPRERAEFLRMGADYVIEKPVEDEELLAVIERYRGTPALRLQIPADGLAELRVAHRALKLAFGL